MSRTEYKKISCVVCTPYVGVVGCLCRDCLTNKNTGLNLERWHTMLFNAIVCRKWGDSAARSSRPQTKVGEKMK
jgi:hypothetical protein